MVRMRASRTWGAGVIALVVTAGCGGSETEDRAAPVPEGPAPVVETGREANRPPVLEWVRIEPDRPAPDSRVRAFARAVDPDGDPVRIQYRWRIDGRDAGTGESVVLRDVERGDAVELEVAATDGGGLSERETRRTEVANRPPIVAGLRLEAPEGLVAGQRIVASPQGVDADGDELRFEYRWQVNGEPVDVEGPVLETEGLRRGDAVEVTVVARDGYEESEPRTSDPVRLGNTAPRIVSSPRWERDGQTFRYQVEARDPDGDRTLRYRLEEGPAGMRIDAIDGVVVWTPEPEQVGTHAVEVVVDDLHGGKTAQHFEVVMEEETGAGSQMPAARAGGY